MSHIHGHTDFDAGATMTTVMMYVAVMGRLNPMIIDANKAKKRATIGMSPLRDMMSPDTLSPRPVRGRYLR